MKFWIPAVLILLLHQGAAAQFGVSLSASQFQFEAPGTASVSNIGPTVGVHYWHRLKDVRIEFYPEATYSGIWDGEGPTVMSQFNWSQFGINLGTRIYPLDFKSDCNCPTFSKQNDLFEKGFFVSMAPGYFYSKGKVQIDPTTVTDPPSDESIEGISTLGLTMGIGLDIGLSDLITLTPNAGYGLYHSFSDLFAVRRALNIGVTLTFRPDY